MSHISLRGGMSEISLRGGMSPISLRGGMSHISLRIMLVAIFFCFCKVNVNLSRNKVFKAYLCSDSNFFGDIFYAIVRFYIVKCFYFCKFAFGRIVIEHIHRFCAKMKTRFTNFGFSFFKNRVFRELKRLISCWVANQTFFKCFISFHSSSPSPDVQS